MSIRPAATLVTGWKKIRSVSMLGAKACTLFRTARIRKKILRHRKSRGAGPGTIPGNQHRQGDFSFFRESNRGFPHP
jgi:hypothetical protein